jgi:hypothetical protein
MKRIATAVLLASLAGSALAADVPGFRPGQPYSQLEVDRALPNVKDPVVDQSASAGATESHPGPAGFREGLPYSGLEVDRALPNVKDPVVTRPSVQVAGPATGIGFTEATGPWANDWNFIAPGL